MKEQLEKEKEKNKIIEKEKIEIKQKNEKLNKKIKSIQNQLSGVLSNIEEKNENQNNVLTPILIGLNNIGKTSYINSILQCLSQTKDLTKFFLEENNKNKIINNNIALKNKNDIQLSPVYLELIKNLWNKNGNNVYSPYSLINIIEKMNSLFKCGQAGDCKDFIIFIIEQLQKELKQKFKNIDYQFDKPLNLYNKDSCLNYFLNDFKKNTSIISDIFFGITETTNICIN